MSVHKFRLGWHACDKMAANRDTNSKFLFFSGGFCPPILGGAIFEPPFFNFGPGGNALKRAQVIPLLLPRLDSRCCGRPRSFTSNHQHKIRIRIYINFSECCPPSSMHISRLLNTELQICGQILVPSFKCCNSTGVFLSFGYHD